jgi:hypothetical protein
MNEAGVGTPSLACFPLVFERGLSAPKKAGPGTVHSLLLGSNIKSESLIFGQLQSQKEM